MKAVILAGGRGTRISEESYLKPKPMVEIGGSPILWHIMKCYSYYGYNDFIICCGYLGHKIKEYFADYYLYRSDITFDFANHNEMLIHNNVAEPWRVTVVDTGAETQTGGRIKRIQKYIGDEPFMVTYGDGLCDLNMNELEHFHRENGKIGTVTAIQPGGRYGVLDIDDKEYVRKFTEKGKEDGGWINGGFMVFQPEIFSYIDDDMTILEREPLERLAALGELAAYRHRGFWKCMDTLRDKNQLEAIWNSGSVPWKVW